jgi:hypothetical protein
MSFTRRAIVFVCILVIVLTAMTPAASTQLSAILVPVWPVFGLVVAAAPAAPTMPVLPPAPVLGSIASRPPPLV